MFPPLKAQADVLEVGETYKVRLKEISLGQRTYPLNIVVDIPNREVYPPVSVGDGQTIEIDGWWATNQGWWNEQVRGVQ